MPQAARSAPITLDLSHREARDVAGLGFGLYIVQEIVRAHGGSVAVQSDDEVRDSTSLYR